MLSSNFIPPKTIILTITNIKKMIVKKMIQHVRVFKLELESNAVVNMISTRKINKTPKTIERDSKYNRLQIYSYPF